jgi:hypothetical protein
MIREKFLGLLYTRFIKSNYKKREEYENTGIESTCCDLVHTGIIQ